MKDILTNQFFLINVAGVIVIFFFGQTGILRTWFDAIFLSKKQREDKKNSDKEAEKKLEKERLDEIKAENRLLREEVEKLREEIYRLDKHLAENTIYTKTLLAWLEKSLPEGSNPFIIEMAKEIRKKTDKSGE